MSAAAFLFTDHGVDECSVRRQLIISSARDTNHVDLEVQVVADTVRPKMQVDVAYRLKRAAATELHQLLGQWLAVMP